MTITHLSAWFILAAGGLFSGGIFFVAVERLNLWQRMPVDQYVVDFRRSVYRADLLMPIMILRANAVIPRREGYPSRHAGRSVVVMGIYNTSSAGTFRPGTPYKYMPLRSRTPRSRRSTVGRPLRAITRIRPSRRVFHQAAPLVWRQRLARV
jgi:hypothetical protein